MTEILLDFFSSFFSPMCTELEFQDCWVMSFYLIKLAGWSLKFYGFCSIKKSKPCNIPSPWQELPEEFNFLLTTRVVRLWAERHREHQTKVCFWKCWDSFDVPCFEEKLSFAEDGSCNEGWQLVQRCFEQNFSTNYSKGQAETKALTFLLKMHSRN